MRREQTVAPSGNGRSRTPSATARAGARAELGERPAPRTRKGRETREVLLKAARTVFERDGFVNARITDITATAGIAYGGFYNYFDSKDEIFWAVLADVRQDMVPSASASATALTTSSASTSVSASASASVSASTEPRVGTRTVADQLRAIERANDEFIASFRRNASIIKVMEEVATYNNEFTEIRRKARTRFITRIHRTVIRLQDAGVADPELDPWCTANALGAMMDRFCYAWFILGDDFDHDVALETLNRLWLNGLGISRSRRPRPRPAI